MNRKTLFQKIMFLSISLTMVGTFFAPSVFKKASAAGIHDFSYDNQSITIDAKSILNNYVANPNQFELDYVNDLDYELKYSNNPNKDNVFTAILDNKLYVYAYEYKATGNNDKEVTWEPSTVSFEGKKYDFVKYSNNYRADISTYSSLDNEMEITYSMNLNLNREIANDIVNGAYEKGKTEAAKMDEEEAAYQAALAEYNQYLLDVEAYDANQAAWNKYDMDSETYSAYLVAKAQYNQQYALYQANKAAWDEYNTNYAKWIKYQTDLAYYNEHHEENQAAYDAFYPNFRKFEYRLNVMNLFYKPMAPMDRIVYDQIIGDSVTQVLDRKADLVELGVSEAIINDAYAATLELRIVLSDYLRCQTDSEKYNYYYNYYTSILPNVEKLLRCLDKLYRSAFVPEAIASQGKDKKEKYLNLVAQLAYIANAMSDKEVYNYEAWNGKTGNLNKPGAKLIDDSWTFIGKTWREYLAGEVFLDVNNEEIKAYPTESKYPTEVVVLIPEPEYVEEPIKPTETLPEPVAPIVVEEPVAPSNRLERPTLVENPNRDDFVNPTTYGIAYKNGELIDRGTFLEDPVFTVNCTAKAIPSNCMKKVCRFSNYDGSFLEDVLFDTHPQYTGETPYKEQDETYNDYLFIGWSINGEMVDLASITESKEVFAQYQGRNLDKFTITFVIGERKESYVCPVGDLPTIPNDISLPETNEHYYVFVSWDKEIEPVHKAETYTAVFDEKNKYEIIFDIAGNEIVQYVKEGLMPEIPTNPAKADSDEYYYEFVSWDAEIEEATRNIKYTAIFDENKFIVISWNIDGNIYKENYKYGETVSYKETEPKKVGTDLNYYKFKGWNIDLPLNAESDLEIIALFDEYNYIVVTYYMHDSTIIKHFEQGEEIVDPTEEDYFDECYIYSLSGFKKLSTSTNSKLYFRAKYTQEYILYYKDAGIRVYINNDNITIPMTERPDSLDLSPLFNLFEKGYEIRPIEIVGKSYNISFSVPQIRYLVGMKFAKISYEMQDLGHKQYKYCISLMDLSGKTIDSLENISISLREEGEFDELKSFAYLDNEKAPATIKQRSIEIALKPGKTYFIYPTYSITLVQSDYGTIILDKDSAVYGEKIVLDYTLSEGYNFVNFSITDTKGNFCNTSKEYVMGEADITVGISIVKQVFLVTFYVDDSVFATSYVSYGEQIVGPTNVFKLSTSDTRYVFIGWDKNLDVATQNEEYHAIFEEIPIEKPNPKNKVSVVAIVKWSAVGTASAGILVAAYFILRKFVFKKH